MVDEFFDYYSEAPRRGQLEENAQHTPAVPAPYRAVSETEKIHVRGGWFQHWSVTTARGKKLKGGIMVKKKHGSKRVYVTTYRDGVHVPGVQLKWLLSVQG